MFVRTQSLNLHIAHFQRLQLLTGFVDIRSLAVLNFHHRAAGKFNRKIQAFGY